MQAILALAVVDIDHFKRLNDTYGHQAGDEVLRLVTRRSSPRRGAPIWPGGWAAMNSWSSCGMTTSKARWRAEAIRRAIADCDVTKIFGKDVLGSVTASIGIAEYREGNGAS